MSQKSFNIYVFSAFKYIKLDFNSSEKGKLPDDVFTDLNARCRLAVLGQYFKSFEVSVCFGTTMHVTHVVFRSNRNMSISRWIFIFHNAGWLVKLALL